MQQPKYEQAHSYFEHMNRSTNTVLSEGLPFSVTGHKSKCCSDGRIGLFLYLMTIRFLSDLNWVWCA